MIPAVQGDVTIQRGVTFDTEPEWMRKARTVPLRTDWESRQKPDITNGSK